MRIVRYVTVDVFTEHRFGGNPLAVVLDADELSDHEMQALAAEFNYSETTFVLPPADPAHTARVRIFNRTHEMPFAGHPNVGTAFVLGEEGTPGDALVFEEMAGIVHVTLERAPDGGVRGATIDAPQALSYGIELDAGDVAACLGLPPELVDVRLHPPIVASTGVPFVLAAVEADGLSEAIPRLDAFRTLVTAHSELAGRLSVFAYVRDGDGVRARMFAPLAGTWEDPATGSAGTALVAHLLALSGDRELRLSIVQGVEMGRPSHIRALAWREADGIHASVGGTCVPVFRGNAAV